MHAVVVEDVPSLIERMPSAPRELDAIVRAALQKQPSARFPTAAAMRDVLAHFVSRSAEGDAGVLKRIIEHNCFDLITLAELAAHLARR